MLLSYYIPRRLSNCTHLMDCNVLNYCGVPRWPTIVVFCVCAFVIITIWSNSFQLICSHIPGDRASIYTMWLNGAQVNARPGGRTGIIRIIPKAVALWAQWCSVSWCHALRNEFNFKDYAFHKSVLSTKQRLHATNYAQLIIRNENRTLAPNTALNAFIIALLDKIHFKTKMYIMNGFYS